MLNQEALNHILDVNAKLSRLNQKIDSKLSRHFRDMERVDAVIARAAAKRRQLQQGPHVYLQQGPHVYLQQGPHVYLQRRCTTWNGMASIGTGDSVTESTQPSKQTARRRIGFIRTDDD